MDDGSAGSRRRSSAEAAAAALYGDQEPSGAAPSALGGEILDSVLRRAASDVLAVIPAQRSVIYTYDRASNLLGHHCSVTADEDALDADQSDGDASHEDPMGFPPTVGMTGACLLQKRCLRMQEPNRHRAFRHEHDVPKGMEVDSVLCAPLIVRHRAIAVIQLLNRVHPDVMETSDEANGVMGSVRGKDGAEDYHDIKLRRAQSVRPEVKLGFSAKDEQRLIQFASHLATTAETRLKRIDDNSATHARIRELQASHAIDLLNIMNARLARRSSDRESAVPIAGPELLQPSRSPSDDATAAPIDLVGALVAIVRLQARFRARRVRRNSDKFAQALETFRRQHERVRSVLVLQRVARGCLTRKRVKKQRYAAAVLSRVYGHYRFRVKLERHRYAKTPQGRRGAAAPPPSAANSSGSFRRRPKAARESELADKALRSATAIQRHVRGHQTRRAVKQLTGLANLGKGLRNIVKLQSFVRGGLARIHFQRAKQLLTLRSMQAPPSVCLRIGMPSAAIDSSAKGADETRTAASCCVYRLPERRSNAFVVRRHSTAPRNRLEALFDQARSCAFGDSRPLAPRASTTPASIEATKPPDGLGPSSRRLMASNASKEQPARPNHRKAPALAAPTPRRSLAALSRAFPGLAWDVQQKKGSTNPPGVEFAADRVVSRLHPSTCCCRRHCTSSSNGDPRGSLGPSTSTSTVGASSPCCCRCCRRVVSNERKLGSVLGRCEEFRREAFVSAVRYHPTLPELPGKQSKARPKPTKSDTQTGLLLCCLLPAQPKLAAAFERAERRLTARAASTSGGATSGTSLTSLTTVEVPSPPRPPDERPD